MKFLNKKIVYFDKNAQEAYIIVSDDHFDILCYAQPYRDEVEEFDLLGFMTENIMRADTNEYQVEKIDEGYFAYRLQGQLIHKSKRIVAIGEIEIKLEDRIPKDIQNCEFIAFNVKRVDFVS